MNLQINVCWSAQNKVFISVLFYNRFQIKTQLTFYTIFIVDKNRLAAKSTFLRTRCSKRRSSSTTKICWTTLDGEICKSKNSSDFSQSATLSCRKPKMVTILFSVYNRTRINSIFTSKRVRVYYISTKHAQFDKIW